MTNSCLGAAPAVDWRYILTVKECVLFLTESFLQPPGSLQGLRTCGSQ